MVNRKMIDPTKTINIVHNNVESLTNLSMKVNEDFMVESAKDRLDPFYIFEDKFTSVPSQIFNPT